MVSPFGFVERKYAVMTNPSLFDISLYTATNHFFLPKFFAAFRLPLFPRTTMSGFSTVSNIS